MGVRTGRCATILAFAAVARSTRWFEPWSELSCFTVNPTNRKNWVEFYQRARQPMFGTCRRLWQYVKTIPRC